MTREKEKIVALNNYIHETSSSGCEVMKENAFIEGFEIADRNDSSDYNTVEKFITAFKKAMEGGAE